MYTHTHTTHPCMWLCGNQYSAPEEVILVVSSYHQEGGIELPDVDAGKGTWVPSANIRC